MAKKITKETDTQQELETETSSLENQVSIIPADEDFHNLKCAAEALIFAAKEPLTEAQFVSAIGAVGKGKLGQIVEELNRDYEHQGRAFEIMHLANGYQFFTRRSYAHLLRKMQEERARTRVTRAGLETLAVVAFRGPVTRSEIDELRGVDSGGVLRTLLEKRMVQVKGRAKVLGRPLLYETTPEFLKHFGLADLSELPRDSELAREWGELQAKDIAELENEESAQTEIETSEDLLEDKSKTGNGHHPIEEMTEAGTEQETKETES